MEYFLIAFKLTVGYIVAIVGFILLMGIICGIFYLMLKIYYEIARKIRNKNYRKVKNANN